jgi:Na+-driven multidrug efflux pump
VFGAGLATTIARAASGALLLLAYFTNRTVLMVEFPRDFAPHLGLISRIMRVGIPGAIERLLFSGSMLFCSRIIAGLGTVPYAAHTIGVMPNPCRSCQAMGSEPIATTLVGQSLGANRPDAAERSTWESFRMASVFVGTMGIVFLLFPEGLMRIYTNDPEVVRLGAIYLRIRSSARFIRRRRHQVCYVHHGIQRFGYALLE